MLKALGTGSLLQVLMVLVGHFVPSLQEGGLFPIGGTIIGAVTGWLAGKGMPGAAIGTLATNGGIAGGAAGAIGSLVSTALGDVPLANVTIAGGSTIVTGALGGLLTRLFGAKKA